MTGNSAPLEIPAKAWLHAAVVLVAVAAATAIRIPFQPLIHDTSPFLFYFPVVVIVAVLFGPRFGLLATAASVLPANYFWMAPERVFALGLTETCQILGFSVAGCSVSWLSDAARKRQCLEEHLRATLATLGAAVFTTDTRGKIIYVNAMAQAITEMHGPEAIGSTVGAALQLVDEADQTWLSGSFQMAIKDDAIENLPRRLILVSKTGKQHHVEQLTSRILGPAGQKLGTALVFHRLGWAADSADQLPAVSVDILNAASRLPRVALISIHGYMAAQPSLEFPDTGGQTFYVLELSAKLARAGYEVDIWTRQFEDQAELETVAPHVRIIRIPCGGRNFIPKERLCEAVPEWCQHAIQFIEGRQLRYEFINSHYWDAGLAGQFLSQGLGLPHIHTPHVVGLWDKSQAELHGNSEPSNLDRRILEEKSLYAAADLIVATNPRQLEFLLHDCKISEEKCRLIPSENEEWAVFAEHAPSDLRAAKAGVAL